MRDWSPSATLPTRQCQAVYKLPHRPFLCGWWVQYMLCDSRTTSSRSQSWANRRIPIQLCKYSFNHINAVTNIPLEAVLYVFLLLWIHDEHHAQPYGCWGAFMRPPQLHEVFETSIVDNSHWVHTLCNPTNTSCTAIKVSNHFMRQQFEYKLTESWNRLVEVLRMTLPPCLSAQRQRWVYRASSLLLQVPFQCPSGPVSCMSR